MNTPPRSPVDGPSGDRAEAIRELEAGFTELMGTFRRLVTENAQLVSDGLSPSAFRVFLTIAQHESISPGSLSETLLTDKSHISRSVRDLENRGLVKREFDPNDARSSLLSATRHGLEQLEKANKPRESALLAELEGWPERDIRNLARLLHRISALSTRPSSS
ncbi:MarR family winged helix-turn-helix transcriptional regulator [Leifsonia sp. NPDC058194]|uniref:MarR family winged helix-turn-helix transcriptional regulator n=1 Tax=Leifsonia sp. NPDC058194 TaxID=3346374 RepID=UPI0036D9C4E8